jgi:hypothetical protein
MGPIKKPSSVSCGILLVKVDHLVLQNEQTIICDWCRHHQMLKHNKTIAAVAKTLKQSSPA